jgi:PEP-CTERM/exosortase A-associated glycosyltransferase
MAGQIRTVLLTRKMIKQKIREKKPDLFHAHSPCLNGLAAIGHGVPFIYEMRSSWEDAAVSEGATREGSLRYRVSTQLETFVARNAAAIIVICEGLRRELVSRGIPAEKITVVPNALPARIFELPSDEEVATLRKTLFLNDSKMIGYFGSFFQWEGVESLVRVLPEIALAVPNVRLLLAGGGRQENSIRKLVTDMGMEEYVLFSGRVPAEDMPMYYALADVMIYPRLSNRLTEMVTPLKPLEAMAQRTPVVASDVGGHRELIDDGRTGFLFPHGDHKALCSKVVDVLQHNLSVESVVTVARQEVEQDRRWEKISKVYLDVYDCVVGE